MKICFKKRIRQTYTIVISFWLLISNKYKTQILGLKIEDLYILLQNWYIINVSLTQYLVDTDLEVCKNSTMGKNNFWKTILIFQWFHASWSFYNFPILHTVDFPKWRRKISWNTSFRYYFTPLCTTSGEKAVANIPNLYKLTERTQFVRILEESVIS